MVTLEKDLRFKTSRIMYTSDDSVITSSILKDIFETSFKPNKHSLERECYNMTNILYYLYIMLEHHSVSLMIAYFNVRVS
jgi:hypothetical protein